MKIIADDKIPFLNGVLEKLAGAEVIYLPGGKISPADVRDADALIIRTRTICNARLLHASKVRFIATATIGFDHLDTAWLKAHNIAWTNAPGCNSASVAQYLCSVLLNLAVKYGFSLRDKTLGVVGVGNVGSKVVEVGRALGMRVLLNDPPRAEKEGRGEFSDLETLLAEADFLTLHVPLEKTGSYQTFHLCAEQAFAAMKKNAFYINSARGEVCDSQALKQALKSGQIAGAVLDVWENEPLVDSELLELLDLTTPHIAGYSLDGKANGTAMSVNALAGFFKLGIPEWYPAVIPEPENTFIKIPNGDSFEEKLLTAVNFSYNVNMDSARLKMSPAAFEEQRGDYPLRREFPAFSVDCRDAEAAKALTRLGFKRRAYDV
ncbi:MAG: 4-phosphoerythronate dehydrogenase PdxB [Victivallales bacterium]|nr:4-phosphoerythronate dehydrogenase PdxB [Victivallales bacterium]